jgi:transposase
MNNVYESDIKPLIKCIKTIRKYFYGIYNYFKHRVTNAQSEGFNNKINIVKRKAYGFWDIEYFMLKIYQVCGWMIS